MALEDFTRHQQGIIRRYYANQPQILKERLAELVTKLFLAEGKKRQVLWKSAADAMKKLGVTQARIDHLLQRNQPELLAEMVKELQ